MLKRLQGLVAGVLIGVLLSAGAVFALGYSKQIEVLYDNITIVIDGEEINPKDANGNVVEPFISEGTTYLPVRAIGEALSMDVFWDGDTKTVYLDSFMGYESGSDADYDSDNASDGNDDLSYEKE